MKFFPLLLLIPLFSLQAWADATVTAQSTSRDYVITGHIKAGTCTLSMPENYSYGDITGLYLGSIAFADKQVLNGYDGWVVNTLPAIGKDIISAAMTLVVDCPSMMSGTTITVKITTPNEIDSNTGAIKHHINGKGEGDFGIKIRNTDSQTDIDFTDATASSVKLEPSTTDSGARAEIHYQASLVRFGDKVVDADIEAPITFNVAYE